MNAEPFPFNYTRRGRSRGLGERGHSEVNDIEQSEGGSECSSDSLTLETEAETMNTMIANCTGHFP